MLFVACALSFASAQHICGVTHDDQLGMISMIEEYNKRVQEEGYTRSTNPLFVPIKFHLVADGDGVGRVASGQVLQQMAVLIEDFRKVNMYAYLDDGWFSMIDNEGIYFNPGTFENSITSSKDPNAVNIFVTQNANTSSGQGVVLGFYSPSGDYIIIRKNDVEGATSSLSHELGHLFSLPHTFFGWEGGWNPAQFNGQVNLVNAPGTNIPVELVDMSNCTVAADRICDTPPDYNFGFGWNGCEFTDVIKDRNGDVIDPMERNYMSYFIGCEPYVFTQGQIDIMHNNFNSPGRANIRKSFIPDTARIESTHDIVEPLDNTILEFYNNIYLDWEDATQAKNYLVTITDQTGKRTEYRTTDSELTIEELSPNLFYFWDVQPYNDGWTDVETKSSFFKTGVDFDTSTEELSTSIQNVVVYPNPSSEGSRINVIMDLKETMDIQMSITDVTGAIVHTQRHTGANGQSMVSIDAQLSTGVYIMKMSTTEGATYKKIVVQ